MATKIARSSASQPFDHAVKEMQDRFIAGWRGYPIVGTTEQVADEVGTLIEAGMEGVIFGLVDYNEKLSYFSDNVMPLLKEGVPPPLNLPSRRQLTWGGVT